MTAYEQMWATRRERYGQSGKRIAPPADPTREELLAQRPTCQRGHDLSVHGQMAKPRRTWYVACRACANQSRQGWRRRQRDARIGAGLIPAGLSEREASNRLRTATKLQKYGETQMSPDGRARQLAAVLPVIEAHAARKREQARCIRGHLFDEQNTRIVKGRYRECRACARLRQKAAKRRRITRPVWLEINGVKHAIAAHDAYVLDRLAALRATMIEAHPDRGGSSAKFRKARAAIDAFVRQETQWYQALGLALPPKDARPDRHLRSADGRFTRRPTVQAFSEVA